MSSASPSDIGSAYGRHCPAAWSCRCSDQLPSGAGVSRATETNPKSNDVALFALGLIETGYRFGGKNPEAGLDCSGMVSYVYQKAIDMRLAGSAADLARQGKPVPLAAKALSAPPGEYGRKAETQRN